MIRRFAAEGWPVKKKKLQHGDKQATVGVGGKRYGCEKGTRLPKSAAMAAATPRPTCLRVEQPSTLDANDTCRNDWVTQTTRAKPGIP